MTNAFYNNTGVPSTRSQGSSAAIRAEFALISAGFNKFPSFSGNAKRLLAINASEDAFEVVTSIDNTPIGATVPSSAAFTSVTATTFTVGTLSATNLSVADLTTTGNTILGNATTDTLNVGSGGIIKDASGNVGLSVTPTGAYKLQIAGGVSGYNYFIGTQATADAGTFGFGNSSGPSMIAWGVSTAGAGRMDFLAGGFKQFDIAPIASAVNFVRAQGNTTGNGPSISVLGTDANVQFNYFTQGSGQHAFWTAGGPQFTINHTAGATRFITVTGSNGGNPLMQTTAGMLQINSLIRNTSTGSSGNDVASSYALAAFDKYSWIDSTRSANNREVEFAWNSGIFLGRFVNDAYSTATNWLTVVGGQSAGVSSITLATGANIAAITADSAQKVTLAGEVQVGNNISGPSTAFAYTIGANPSASVTTGGFLQLFGSTSGAPGQVVLGNSGTGRLTITGAGLIVESSTGFELGYKGMPAASVTTGAFVASDRGKCIYATGNVTIPNATMALGDVVVIQNTTGSSLTITKTITTAYNCTTGTALGATFSLGARGRMAIVFESGTVCDISGNIS